MSEDLDAAKKRLRQYLNPTLNGPNVDNVIESLASGPCHLIDSVESVYDQLYVVTAQGRYLDQRMADRGITRPDNVGLDDETFREVGIAVSTRKQVRDLIQDILRIMYGNEFTRATLVSSELEPYQLADQDTLILQFDDSDTAEVIFDTSQFTNIAAATAQEVSDAITRELRRLGKTGAAVAKDDGLGGFVQLISGTDGPSSTAKVLGGRAQNKLKFEQIRPTSGDASTQWTLTVESGGIIKATWTGGADPSIGKIQKDDYVNIFGTSFDTDNQGTFTITEVQGGLINESYVKYQNINGISEVVVQGTLEAILFFNPVRSTINSKTTFAVAYQTESNILEVFMPATTRVVRRDREGSAHLHDSGPSGDGNEGPYIFDPSSPFLIGGEEANTTQLVDSSTSRIINVDDSSEMPDETGHLVFGFGTSNQEGPVPYIARPSNNTILIDPSYRFEKVHQTGTNISLVAQNTVFDVARDGTDFPFYITDIVSGRIYAEELIDLVKAAGVNVIITILYPDPIGLENWNETEQVKKDTWQQVWGPDAE